MQRIHLSKSFIFNEIAQLTSETHHHLFTVCRLKIGAKIEIVVDEKRLMLVQISNISDNGFNFSVLDQFSLIPPRKIPVNIIQSLPKQDKMTEICKLCTEIGVSNIYPVSSEFCDVYDINDNKLNRIRKSILSAVSQSKQMIIPKFHDCLSLSNQLNEIRFPINSLLLLAYEASSIKLSDFINDISYDSVFIAIGPEGGYSDADLSIFKNHNFNEFSLGPSILRTEHAAFAAINYLDGFLINFP